MSKASICEIIHWFLMEGFKTWIWLPASLPSWQPLYSYGLNLGKYGGSLLKRKEVPTTAGSDRLLFFKCCLNNLKSTIKNIYCGRT